MVQYRMERKGWVWTGIVLLLCLLLTPEASRGQLLYSFSAGPNFSKLDLGLEDLQDIDDPLENLNYDFTVGFHLGVGTGVKVGPVYLRTGISFVNAGAIFNGSTFLEDDEFDVNFITVPVDIKVNIPISERITPYISGGPEFRYRLNLDVNEEDMEFVDDLDRLIPTATIGAGVSIDLPVLGIGFSPELRYAIDFLGLVRGEVTIEEQALRIKRAFKADILSLGIVLEL